MIKTLEPLTTLIDYFIKLTETKNMNRPGFVFCLIIGLWMRRNAEGKSLVLYVLY